MMVTPAPGSAVSVRRGSSAIKIGPSSEVNREAMQATHRIKEEEEVEEPSKPRFRKWLWISAGVWGIIIAVVAAVMFGSGQKPKPGDQKADNSAQKVDSTSFPNSVVPTTPDTILTPAEAITKVGERVTVQYVVASFGGKSYFYLNSSKEFQSKDNIAVALPPKTQTGKWANPTAELFVGKLVAQRES